MMRKAPTLLAGVFVSITLVRVAEYASGPLSAGWLGWVFALALGSAVFVSAYYTREHIRQVDGREQDRRDKHVRQAAWVAVGLFVSVDGLLNLADVLLKADTSTWYYAASAWAYGLVPTIGAGVLGWLQGYIDRLPHPPGRPGVLAALRVATVRRLEARHELKPQVIAAPEKAYRYRCPICGKGADSPQSHAGHVKSCKSKIGKA